MNVTDQDESTDTEMQHKSEDTREEDDVKESRMWQHCAALAKRLGPA